MKLFLFITFALLQYSSGARQPAEKTVYTATDTSRVNSCIAKVKELGSRSPVAAIQYGLEGARIAEGIPFPSGECNLYASVASFYNQLGKPDSAEYCFKKALAISKSSGLLSAEVVALKGISELYRSTGRFDEALTCYKELEEKSRRAGMQDAYALSFSGRSIVYRSKNDPVKTLEFMQKAVSVFDSLPPKKEYALALTGIALIYSEMKQPDKADKLYRKIIALYRRTYPEELKARDFNGAAITFLNMGAIYKDQLQSDSCLYFLDRSVELAKKYGLKKVLALAELKTGETWFSRGNKNLGEKYFLEAYNLYHELNNPLGKLYALDKLHSLYESADMLNKAEPALLEAISIAGQLGDSGKLRECYLKAAVLYSKTQDYKKAYKYRLMYETQNERLYNSENNRHINEMLAKYEASAKEKENLLLQKENDLSLETIRRQRTQTSFIIIGIVLTLLLIFFILRGLKLQRDNYSLKVKEQEVQLIRLNEMKTLAELKTLQARINPHFLYNSLNSITSLIYEKPEQAEEMTIKLSRLFRYSINTQEANWSTVKEELTIVRIYLDIERVRFSNRISFTINADESIQNMMIPRFLLQPLVENALKHGLKDKEQNGNLEVTIRDKQEQVEISVYDNGTPFPGQMVAGYGMQSIHDKLNLLCGSDWKMSFTNTGEKRICIELPKKFKT